MEPGDWHDNKIENEARLSEEELAAVRQITENKAGRDWTFEDKSLLTIYLMGSVRQAWVRRLMKPGTFFPKQGVEVYRPALSEEDAEDLIQEWIIRSIWDNPTFDPARSNGGFLRYCWTNMQARVRSLVKKQWVSLDEPIGNDDDGRELTRLDLLASEAPRIDSIIAKRELVEEGLSWLSEREVQILVLIYDEEFGQEEIATMLNLKRGTVAQIKRRALEKIREALGKDTLRETQSIEEVKL